MTPAHPKPGKKGKTIGQRSRDQVDAIRPQVYLRDDYRCVVSGTTVGATSPCEGNITLQHRVGRGAGGSALFDGPAHLVVMCLRHNVLETSSADFAAACLTNGWSLRRNAIDVDPTQVPVRYRDGWYLLDADGCSRQLVPPMYAAQLMEQAS
jgi:hypothetical protein